MYCREANTKMPDVKPSLVFCFNGELGLRGDDCTVLVYIAVTVHRQPAIQRLLTMAG